MGREVGLAPPAMKLNQGGALQRGVASAVYCPKNGLGYAWEGQCRLFGGPTTLERRRALGGALRSL